MILKYVWNKPEYVKTAKKSSRLHPVLSASLIFVQNAEALTTVCLQIRVRASCSILLTPSVSDKVFSIESGSLFGSLSSRIKVATI